MNILVAGGAGYVGSHACKALAARDYVPFAYDNLSREAGAGMEVGPFEKGDIAVLRPPRPPSCRRLTEDKIFGPANIEWCQKAFDKDKAVIVEKLSDIGCRKKARPVMITREPFFSGLRVEARFRTYIEGHECPWCRDSCDLLEVAIGDHERQINEDPMRVNEVSRV
jgi:hypothetical protein